MDISRQLAYSLLFSAIEKGDVDRVRQMLFEEPYCTMNLDIFEEMEWSTDVNGDYEQKRKWTDMSAFILGLFIFRSRILDDEKWHVSVSKKEVENIEIICNLMLDYYGDKKVTHRHIRAIIAGYTAFPVWTKVINTVFMSKPKYKYLLMYV